MSGHEFCRILLRETMKTVRKHVSSEEIKKAWAYKTGFGDFEFHGPEDFYAYSLHGADCLWSAKAEGWQKYLESKGVEE